MITCITFYTMTTCKSGNCNISSTNIFIDSHNPESVIFNFSLYELTDGEKNVLCKGLNFSVKSGLIEDLLSEYLYNEDISFIKARLLDTALTHA